MNATCFMIYSNTIPVYTSFLKNWWVDPYYPEFNSSNLSSDIDEFMHLKWIDSLAKQDLEETEALTTRECNNNQCILDTGATNHTSGKQVVEAKSIPESMTVPGGRKLKMTAIGEASLNVSQGLITIQRVLRVAELGRSRLLS